MEREDKMEEMVSRRVGLVFLVGDECCRSEDERNKGESAFTMSDQLN